MEAAGVHLGVSKTFHGILLAIMALYWNLDLLRLQAKHINAYPQEHGPPVTCVKSLFTQVPCAVVRWWGEEVHRAFYTSAERNQKGLQLSEQ